MRILYLLFFVVTAQTSFAQADSLQNPFAESKILHDAGEPVFNGREHIQYLPSFEGIAYYGSDEWQKGRLVYSNVAYKDAFLKYDLVTDELIIRHLNGFTGITLFTPRIQEFSLGNRQFVYLGENQPGIQPGIYELLTQGKITVYAKHSKTIQEKVGPGGIERKFLERNNYYVLKGGIIHVIKKEKDIMNLLPEKKDEISSYLKEKGIKYKSNPEGAITSIVEYYNQTNR